MWKCVCYGLNKSRVSTCLLVLCEGVLQELQSSREKLEDLWSARKLKLDLALQLRVFEQDALEVCATLCINS